ncbi:MAG TPA: hypothetical protein VGY53_07725 [Isosphaeraceae bacterium]|nr:hypothetical protein [Isosphaeraceae bacterium]
MVNQPDIAKRPRLPWGLAGMLAVVLGVEGLLAHCVDDCFKNPSAACWQEAGRVATSDALRSHVLAFGDSIVKFGFVPRVIEAEAGLSAYNLATDGGPPALSYFLLRRALKAGARPRAVVVNISLDILAAPPHVHDQLWHEMLTPNEAFELCWRARDPALLSSLFIARVLISYRTRFEIREVLRCAIRRESYARCLASLITGRRAQWRIHRGGELLPEAPNHSVEPDYGNPQMFPGKWSADPANSFFARKFFELAAAHRIPVYLLLPPRSPLTQVALEGTGSDAYYTLLIRKRVHKCDKVVVVDARYSGFNDAAFFDMTHLVGPGAITLSAELAGILKRDLATGHPNSRWVQLPQYRDRHREFPLEDLEHREVAMGPRAAARQ